MVFKYEVIGEAMKLLGMKYPDLSAQSGISESTIKKIARGESENPNLYTLYHIFKPLGLSIDRACGLAPERDMEKEAAQHNVSMAKALNERLVMQDEKIDALREKISEQKAEIAAQKTLVDAKTEAIAHRDQIIKGKDGWIRVLVCVIITIVLADILFANAGWLNFGIIK